THGKGRLNELYRQRYGLERLFLHASRLTVQHPHTGALLDVHDPLPTELARVISNLRDELAAMPAVT
ncbi:MAG: hypothetical protein WCR59_07940, partial [Planctomycetota bacterium]